MRFQARSDPMYFRRHFDQGAPWTFVVQNKAPHCCIMNAKGPDSSVGRCRRSSAVDTSYGSYGFIKNQPSEAVDCPGQSAPASVLVSQHKRHVGWRELVGHRGNIRPASESTKRDDDSRLAAHSNICKAVGLVRNET
jgi:hypothetical protein